jgi:integrase
MILDDFAKYCWTFLPVSKKTLSNYKGAYNRNISPSLGKFEIQQVTQRDLLDVLVPLTPQNYYQTLMVARVIFREAINRAVLDESAASNIQAPKIRLRPQTFLTWEEVKREDFGKYDSHIKFLALHGLRWGEALALSSKDIYDQKVYINKSIHGPTKTSSGVRQVPYFGYFKEFPKSRNAIASALNQHGVTIHSLRKTYAYFLKTNNVHVTTAAKLMGHSNPLITLKIYTQVKDTEIDEIGKVLRKKLNLKYDEPLELQSHKKIVI